VRGQWRWVVVGVLLVLGALAGSGVVWLHWRACTGPQVSTADWGYAEDPGPGYGDACLQAMDDGFSFLYPDGKGPFRPEALFGLALALLVAASWAVVLLSRTWRRSTRAAGALTLGLVLLVAVLGLQPRSGAMDRVFTPVQLVLGLSVLLTLVLVLVQDAGSARDRARAALALCGPAAMGFVAFAADYSLMVTISEADWDTPPWTGTPTVVATALAGIAVLVLSVRRRPAPPEAVSGTA